MFKSSQGAKNALDGTQSILDVILQVFPTSGRSISLKFSEK